LVAISCAEDTAVAVDVAVDVHSTSDIRDLPLAVVLPPHAVQTSRDPFVQPGRAHEADCLRRKPGATDEIVHVFDGLRRKYDGKRQVADGEWRMNVNDIGASVCRGAAERVGRVFGGLRWKYSGKPRMANGEWRMNGRTASADLGVRPTGGERVWRWGAAEVPGWRIVVDTSATVG